ncbi:MAG: pentapeptide repeat-containing protein [Winogradskyella sp.]
MNLPLIDNKEFKNKDFTTNKLPTAEYNECKFINCNFEASDVSNNSFLECEFIDCNLSNVKVKHTILNDVYFSDCKLIGIHFYDCNDFLLDFKFSNCTLNYSSFYRLKVNNTKFTDCKLQHVDFTEASANNVSFENCDLKDAIFDQTSLQKTQFETAFNISINPTINNLKGAIFSKENCFGLLDSFHVKIKS